MSCFISERIKSAVNSVIRIITTSTKDVKNVAGVWTIQIEFSLVVIKTVRVYLGVTTIIGDNAVNMTVVPNALIVHVMVIMVAAPRAVQTIFLADVGKLSICNNKTLNLYGCN